MQISLKNTLNHRTIFIHSIITCNFLLIHIYSKTKSRNFIFHKNHPVYPQQPIKLKKSPQKTKIHTKTTSRSTIPRFAKREYKKKPRRPFVCFGQIVFCGHLRRCPSSLIIVRYLIVHCHRRIDISIVLFNSE